jgi:hypothetical protein
MALQDYLRLMLPLSGRNSQLIYPNYLRQV